MSIITNLFTGGIDKTIDAAGKIVDGVITTDDEKLKLKNQLSTVIMDGFGTFANVVRDIALADASGNWLQRSWRPILLLSFGFTLLVNYAINPMLARPAIVFPDEFWTFLNIIVPTTVVARSYEKVSGAFSKNIDLAMLKKRDRDEAFEKSEKEKEP